MRDLIKLNESDLMHIISETVKQTLREMDAGGAMGGDIGTGGDGATNASSSGQFVTPLFGKKIRKAFYYTEEPKEKKK